MRTVLIGGQAARAPAFISATTYLQHNPMVADGLSSLGEALVALAANGMAMRYLKTHRIVAEGDMVFVMSEGLMGQTPTAFFDLFRVANGEIVEHWDTMAEIPAQMAHANGKFYDAPGLAPRRLDHAPHFRGRRGQFDVVDAQRAQRVDDGVGDRRHRACRCPPRRRPSRPADCWAREWAGRRWRAGAAGPRAA